MNRLGVAILTVILLVTGAAVALGSSSEIPTHQGNAAVTQYEPTPPVIPYTPGTPPGTPETGTHTFKKHHKKKNNGGNGNQGIKGHHEQGHGPVNGNQGNGNGNANGNGESATRPVSFESASTGPSGGAGGLPFTGFDLIALLGVGLLMIGVGLAQRRYVERRDRS
jgi:hypothetical protein